MSGDGKIHEAHEKRKREAGPAAIPWQRSAAYTQLQSFSKCGNPQLAVEERIGPAESDKDKQRPSQELEALQLRDRQLVGVASLNLAEVGGAFREWRVRGTPERRVSAKLKTKIVMFGRAGVEQRVADEPDIGGKDEEELPQQSVDPFVARQNRAQHDESRKDAE